MCRGAEADPVSSRGNRISVTFATGSMTQVLEPVDLESAEGYVLKGVSDGDTTGCWCRPLPAPVVDAQPEASGRRLGIFWRSPAPSLSRLPLFEIFRELPPAQGCGDRHRARRHSADGLPGLGTM